MYRDGSAGGFSLETSQLIFAGLAQNLTLTYSAERKLPYYYMVTASNQLGFGHGANFQAFAQQQVVGTPSSPQNLTAHVIGVKLVELVWQLPIDTGVGDSSRSLTEYTLQSSVNQTFSPLLQSSAVPGSALSWVVQVPSIGPAFYWFRLFAINEAGTSNASSDAKEQGVGLPGSPTNLTASTFFNQTVFLAWGLPGDTGINGSGRAIVAYRIVVSAFGANVSVAPLIVSSPSSSTNVTSLSYLIVYTFQVYAINDAGQGVTAATISVQPVTYPSSPMDFSATVQQERQIILRWRIPANTGQGGQLKMLDGYLLEMDNATVNASFTSPSTVTVWTISCLNPQCSFSVSFYVARAQPYLFRLRAKNEVGLSAAVYASEQSIDVPTAPLFPYAQVAGPRQIRISWTIPENTGVGNVSASGQYNRPILNYTVEQSFGNSSFLSALTTTVLSADSRELQVTLPIASSVFYYFRIYANNSAGISPPSNTVSEQSIDLASLSNISVNISGPLQMIVTWTYPVNFGTGDRSRPLLRFVLQVAENITADYTWLQRNVSANTTSQSISGFSKGLTYYFRVAAVNSAGIGPFANASKDAIGLSSAATNFTARVVAPIQINLAWKVPSDTGFYTSDPNRIDTFVLQYSTNNITWSNNIVLSMNTYSYIAQGLTKGLIYIFKLWIVNDAGISASSSICTEQAIDVPSSPLEFSAAIKAPFQFNVSWMAPIDTGRGVGVMPPRALTSYIIDIVYSDYPPVSQQANFALINFSVTVDPSALFKILSNLTKSKTVFARIRATNNAGSGNYSSTAEQYVVNTPTAPTLTSIVATPVMSISIQWSSPIDTGTGAGKPWPLTVYRLQISLNTSFLNGTSNFTLQPNVTSTQISQSNFSLIAGYLYYIRIFAVNLVGESNSSQVGMEHALEAPSLPLSLNVVVSTALEEALLVSWIQPSDSGLRGQPCFVSCSGPFQRTIWYVVQRVSLLYPPDVVGGASPQNPPNGDRSYLFNQSSEINTVVLDGSITFLDDTGLHKGFTYYYRVYAYNSAGQGSATNSVYEMAISVPSSVLNTTLQNVVYFTGYIASLVVHWSNPLDNGNGQSPTHPRPLLYFRLQISQISDDNLYMQLDFDINTFTYNATGLTKGRVYFFRLTAANAAGQSNYSAWIYKTAVSRPTPPYQPQPLVTNPGEITLYWFSPLDTGATGQTWPIQYFTVDVSTSANFTSEDVVIINGDNTGNTSNFDGSRYFFVQDGLNSAVFFFRVYATNVAGQSDASATVNKMVIDLPSTPRSFSALRNGPLSIIVSYERPSFTGSSKSMMPLSYILEMSLLDDNFINSPFFVMDCYPGMHPACTSATESPYDIGINGSAGIVYNPSCPLGIDYVLKCTSWVQTFNDSSGIGRVYLTGLIRGHTYYFRIFAANDAGLSVPTKIISNISVGLSTQPQFLNLSLEGFLAFRISWAIPADTGIGNTTWPIEYYVVEIQPENFFTPVPFGEGTVAVIVPAYAFDVILTNQHNNISIQAGIVYYVRAYAQNEVGAGNFSRVANNRPSVTGILPTHGPAVGNSSITLYGERFGDQGSSIKIQIGSTSCVQISVVAYQEQVKCFTPPASSGSKVVNVSVQGIQVLDAVNYVYDSPAVTSVIPSSVSLYGSETVTLYGANFGSFDQSPAAYLESRSVFACTSTLWTSDSSVSCAVPRLVAGVGYNNTAVLLVGSSKSNRWDPGSIFTFHDIPLYFQCLRKTTSECFHCVYEKCNMEAINNYLSSSTLDSAKASWLQPSKCDSIGLQYCNYDNPVPIEPLTANVLQPIPSSFGEEDSSSLRKKLQSSRGAPCQENLMVLSSEKATRSLYTNACPRSVKVLASKAKCQDLAFHLPVLPVINKLITPLTAQVRQGVIGVAIDGVPFYSATDSSRADLVARAAASLDKCGGRVSGSGVYHYLLDPVCIYSDTPSSHSPVIGLMLDGIPLFGRLCVGGLPPADLDMCNGHTDAMHKFYHYHVTDTFPYIVGCFRGCLLSSTLDAVNGGLRLQQCQQHRVPYTYDSIQCFISQMLGNTAELKCTMEARSPEV